MNEQGLSFEEIDIENKSESALRKLNTLPIPVFTVIGNIDYTRTKPDTIDVDWNKKWKWDLQDFFSKIGLNVFGLPLLKINIYSNAGS